MKIPKELTVTINVPHVQAMKLAKLDINETNLIFEYPNLYYLDLNLKYFCDSNNGTAKFDKSKKTLTIRVPVTGLTEDSQKVFEENFKKFSEIQNKKKQELENLKKEEEEDKKKEEVKQLVQEAATGESERTILPSIDVIGGDNEDLKDQYELSEKEVDLEKLKQEALKEGGDD